jgi:hypothetical protein
MIPGNINTALISGAEGGYAISRSLRFNSADSAYLSRTPASAGNRKTWTWAGWVKLSSLAAGGGSYVQLLGTATSDTIWAHLGFVRSTSKFYFWDYTITGSGGPEFVSSPVFRDFSAWYHIVFVSNTAASTAADRRILYVNGVRQQTDQNNAPTQNTDGHINTASVHRIGRFLDVTFTNDLNGYLADIHFIDGQALDPTSFGEFSATTGVWVPKAYTGTYGTNGFRLDFADNSSNTTTTLGKDTSGNGNNWLPNNLSIGISGNTSQNWSATASIAGQAGFEATKAFDGDASSSSSTYYFPGTNGTGTFTFAQSVPYSTAKIWYGRTNGRLFVNGIDMGIASTGYSVLTQTDLTAKGVSSPLTSIGLERVSAGNGAYLFGVEVNGSQLIDPVYSAGNDSLIDVPTNGSEVDSGLGGQVRGNYATLNPLARVSNNAFPLSNGNLDATSPNDANYYNAIASIPFVAGSKFYCEVTCNTLAVAGDGYIGLWTVDSVNTGSFPAGANTGTYRGNGNITNLSGTNQTAGSSWTANDVIGIAVDVDAGTVRFYKNGVAQGANPSFSFTAGTSVYLRLGTDNSSGVTAFSCNFGQRPFAYTAPSGFKALCTANLPAPVITKPNTVMDVALYTGNGSTQTISGLGFSPDLVWLKSRNDGVVHLLYDSVRGAGQLKSLQSNTTNPETTASDDAQYGYLSAFTSTGFSVDAGTSNYYANNSASTYVAWTWDAGSSTVTNTQGSISSQVRANASAGFSVVTWTPQASAGTVGHGLGVAPAMIITKDRDKDTNWFIYHSALGATKYLMLDRTNAVTTNSTVFSTAPTSTVFDQGTGFTSANNYGKQVCYCFAPVAGYSAFGSYTGNGSADGPFVFTGMRPRWIMVKISSASGEGWAIQDSTRFNNNPASDILAANSNGSETGFGGGFRVDLLSNGFKLRSTQSAHNASGVTYIYAAFAEAPFQYARAR